MGPGYRSGQGFSFMWIIPFLFFIVFLFFMRNMFGPANGKMMWNTKYGQDLKKKVFSSRIKRKKTIKTQRHDGYFSALRGLMF